MGVTHWDPGRRGKFGEREGEAKGAVVRAHGKPVLSQFTPMQSRSMPSLHTGMMSPTARRARTGFVSLQSSLPPPRHLGRGGLLRVIPPRGCTSGTPDPSHVS